jgi:hypothetical protein
MDAMPCRSLVQVIAARLIESGIWAGDEVSSEPWLDPKKGMVSFMLDLMVAEGKLTGSWSEEKGQRNYYLPEFVAVSHLSV